jgi:hypothetical protein
MIHFLGPNDINEKENHKRNSKTYKRGVFSVSGMSNSYNWKKNNQRIHRCHHRTNLEHICKRNRVLDAWNSRHDADVSSRFWIWPNKLNAKKYIDIIIRCQDGGSIHQRGIINAYKHKQRENKPLTQMINVEKILPFIRRLYQENES